jgi:hypothetical protein
MKVLMQAGNALLLPYKINFTGRPCERTSQNMFVLVILVRKSSMTEGPELGITNP